MPQTVVWTDIQFQLHFGKATLLKQKKGKPDE